MNKSSRRGVVALWDERTHLLLGVTVAAHSPQVLESSPQEDDEETPKESDHGRGEESPPHPLAVAVTGHIWRERDDHAHLGYVDGRVRVEFIPVFRHYRSLVTWPAPAHNNQKNERKKEKKNSTGVGGKRFRRFGELQPAPPDAPAAQPCFKSTTSRSSLPSHLASPSGVKSWVEQRDTRTIKYVFFLKKTKTSFEIRRSHQSCASRCAFMAGLARHPFWFVRKNHIFFPPPQKNPQNFPTAPPVKATKVLIWTHRRSSRSSTVDGSTHCSTLLSSSAARSDSAARTVECAPRVTTKEKKEEEK